MFRLYLLDGIILLEFKVDLESFVHFDCSSCVLQNKSKQHLFALQHLEHTYMLAIDEKIGNRFLTRQVMQSFLHVGTHRSHGVKFHCCKIDPVLLENCFHLCTEWTCSLRKYHDTVVLDVLGNCGTGVIHIHYGRHGAGGEVTTNR